jgi:predicted O-methyltransferase YrrM
MNGHEQEQTTVVTVDTQPDPGQLIEMATAYWASATLLAANDLGVFAFLAEGSASPEAVAARTRTNPAAMRRLLDACCGLNLLVKQGDLYMAPPACASFLTPGRAGYLGSGLKWAWEQFPAWSKLTDSVRSGMPAVDPRAHLGDDKDRTRDFVMAMHERAASLAAGVVEFIHLDDSAERLLDVGGGGGTYSMLLAKRQPNLHVTLLDLPGITAVASELISKAGMSERVQVLPGDATEADYGESYYDAVLYSGVLHQMAPTTILRMLRSGFRALVDGGAVFVSDIMLDATRTQPAFSALFSLQMLLTSREGATFAVEDCHLWLTECGFRDVEIHRLPEPIPYTIVMARK